MFADRHLAIGCEAGEARIALRQCRQLGIADIAGFAIVERQNSRRHADASGVFQHHGGDGIAVGAAGPIHIHHVGFHIRIHDRHRQGIAIGQIVGSREFEGGGNIAFGCGRRVSGSNLHRLCRPRQFVGLIGRRIRCPFGRVLHCPCRCGRRGARCQTLPVGQIAAIRIRNIVRRRVDRHLLTLPPIKLVQPLLQRHRLGRGQRQLDALPILAAGIFQHRPCLQARLVMSIDDHLIGRFPDRRRNDIGETDITAVLHAVHLDIDGAGAIVLAAGNGCRRLGELCSRVGIVKADGRILAERQRLHGAIPIDNGQQVGRCLFIGLPGLYPENASFYGLATAGDRHLGALHRCQKRRHG